MRRAEGAVRVVLRASASPITRPPRPLHLIPESQGQQVHSHLLAAFPQERVNANNVRIKWHRSSGLYWVLHFVLCVFITAG